MKTNEVKCPFIESTFYCRIDTESKPTEIRIDCFEETCPAKLYEPLKCLNPTEEDVNNHVYIGGHCKYITNICESFCRDLKKCKKTGDARIPCRQEIIDKMFRAIPSEISTNPVEP